MDINLISLKAISQKEEIYLKNNISDLYEIKQSYKSTDPMYLISKLLMNSLYGKFGMDPNMLTHIIINNAEI